MLYYGQRSKVGWQQKIRTGFWGADMEAPMEVRGVSEWVMKVTDKWGQRERGYYSVGEQKCRHSGWWGWQTNAGGKEKEYVSRWDKEPTWISWGEVRSLRRVNHSIRYSSSHLQRTFFNRCFTNLLVVNVCTAFKVKVQKIEILAISESLTHSKPFSKRFYRFLVCLLID